MRESDKTPKLQVLYDTFHKWFDKGVGTDRIDTAFEAGWNAALDHCEEVQKTQK